MRNIFSVVPALKSSERLYKASAIIFTFSFFVVIYGYQQALNWPIVRIWKASPWGSPISSDLRVVLHAAACHREDGDITYAFGADADGCNVIYGRFLTDSLGILGLNETHTTALSWLFVLLFSALASIVTVTIGMKYGATLSWVSVGLFLSPPAALLLERANFDVMMTFGIYLAAWFARGQRASITMTILMITSLVKFYTLPLAILAAIFLFRGKPRMLWISACLVVAAFIVSEYFTRSLWFPDDPGAAFGVSTLPLWLNLVLDYVNLDFALDKVARHIVGLVLLILATGYLSKVRFPLETKPNETERITLQKLGRYYLFSLCVFLSCYFAGTNYDYRMTTWFVVGLLTIAKLFPAKKKMLPSVVLLATAWLSYNSGVVGQIIGDTLMTLCVAWLLVRLFETKEIRSSVKRLIMFRSLTRSSTT